jgi:hypothetical protein
MNIFDVTTSYQVVQNKDNERCLTMNDYDVYMKLCFAIGIWIFDKINAIDAL